MTPQRAARAITFGGCGKILAMGMAAEGLLHCNQPRVFQRQNLTERERVTNSLFFLLEAAFERLELDSCCFARILFACCTVIEKVASK